LPDRFAVLIGMIISVILITRAFTKPIYTLMGKMHDVADGDYTAQAPVSTDDEIGILTSAFNDMVHGLKERELIRDTFGRYVTRDVASVILNEQIDLSGEMRPCTILFTDIEDYTTMSEALTPKEIVETLNAYFSTVVDIIQRHHGIVNKFIGDSVFAMFNVPSDDPDHAIHAVEAAIEIVGITATRTFGKSRQLRTRIGINSGLVVAGNIGSKDRLEYTVIGDDVNIASRLEELNKQYGTQILIGENTKALATAHFDFSELGEFQLRGKEKPIKVYRVNPSP